MDLAPSDLFHVLAPHPAVQKFLPDTFPNPCGWVSAFSADVHHQGRVSEFHSANPPPFSPAAKELTGFPFWVQQAAIRLKAGTPSGSRILIPTGPNPTVCGFYHLLTGFFVPKGPEGLNQLVRWGVPLADLVGMIPENVSRQSIDKGQVLPNGVPYSLRGRYRMMVHPRTTAEISPSVSFAKRLIAEQIKRPMSIVVPNPQQPIDVQVVT